MPSDLTHPPNICPVEFPTSFVLSVAVCSFIDSYWLITNIIGWFFISLSKQEKLKKISPHYCWGNLGGVHMSQENNLSTFNNFFTQFCFFFHFPLVSFSLLLCHIHLTKDQIPFFSKKSSANWKDSSFFWSFHLSS